MGAASLVFLELNLFHQAGHQHGFWNQVENQITAANKCQLINGVGWKFPLGARSFISIFILCEAYGMNWAIAELRASTKKD